MTKPFCPFFTIDLACDLVLKLNGRAPAVFDAVRDLVRWAEGFHAANEAQRVVIRREVGARANAIVQDVKLLPAQVSVECIEMARLLNRSTRTSW